MKRSTLSIALLAGLLAAACATAPPVEPVAPAVPSPPAPSAPTPPAPPAPAPPAVADPAAAPLDAAIPVDPAVREGRLDNGLTFVIKENRQPEERAELWLVVNAGSVLEDEDQQGLAHFVEHMAFNGTEHFEKHEILNYLESLGMRFGPDLNAYTSLDETVYMLRVPTDDSQVVETGVEILAEWAQAVAFEDEEIDKERGVVVEEWRLGRGASMRILDAQLPVLLKGSRYAERLPIGKKEIIETAPYEALRRFYRDWYRPDLMAVVAVGDFDGERIEALVREKFGPIPEPEDAPPRPTYPIPEHEETLVSVTTDPEAPGTSVSIYYKGPKPSEGTYGDYRRSLVEGLFDAMLNARLDEVARQPDPPFLYAGTGSGSFVREGNLYYQVAGVKDGGLARGLEALLVEVERVDRHGFTETELSRTRKDLLRGFEQSYEERDKSDSRGFASEFARHFLTGEPIPGIAVELTLARRFLPTITLEEVNRLAQERIGENNRVILVSAPDKPGVELPGEEELLADFREAEAGEIDPYVDAVQEGPLVTVVPASGPVVEESVVEEIGVTEWRLSNGVRVVLKPTDFKNDEILLTGFSPGGHSLVGDERQTSGRFASTLVSEGGLGRFSRIELEKALAGKVAGASPFISELEEGVTGIASPSDVSTMLQLVYLTFTAPRRDEEAYRSFAAKLRAFVENREASPEIAFYDRLTQVLTGDHPRYRPLSRELLEEVSYADAFDIYRERFADASDFTFILVGNFEPEELRPDVERYLGGLPSLDRHESFRDVGVRPPEGVEEFEVHRGLEPKSQVSLLFTGPGEWSRQNLHAIGSLASALQIRLRDVLREELGATYSVGVQGSISAQPKEEYRFSISFGCAPENVDRMVETVFEEIRKAQREGVDEETAAKVRESQTRKRQTDLRDNRFWAQVLRTYYTLDLDPRLVLDYHSLVEEVTGANLGEAARRYLREDRHMLGVLVPEEQAAPGPEAAASGE